MFSVISVTLKRRSLDFQSQLKKLSTNVTAFKSLFLTYESYTSLKNLETMIIDNLDVI